MAIQYFILLQFYYSELWTLQIVIILYGLFILGTISNIASIKYSIKIGFFIKIILSSTQKITLFLIFISFKLLFIFSIHSQRIIPFYFSYIEVLILDISFVFNKSILSLCLINYFLILRLSILLLEKIKSINFFGFLYCTIY